MIRLDKLLSSLGYCSRSEVREFIREKEVLISGEPAHSSDQKVVPARVTIDGAALDPSPPLVIMLHKPVGFTCSHKDEGPLIYELLPPRFSRRRPPLSCVGRLDKETTGLLLLTDDGDLLHQLTSPRHKVEKIYEATLEKPLRGDEAQLFESGTLILEGEEKPLKPATLKILEPKRIQITLTQGLYHQVRRMFAAIGNHVLTLHRLQVGALTLDGLEEGKFRILNQNLFRAGNFAVTDAT